VGLAVTFGFLVRAFGLGLLSGVRIATAQATGAGRDARVARLGWQALWLAGGLGLAALPFAALAPAVLARVGSSAEVVGLASSYLRVTLGGAALTFALYGLSAWFQGRGDTRTPMFANVASNTVNLALTPALAYGWLGLPALGIAGAALATVLGTAVGVGILLVPLWRSSGPGRRGLDRDALGAIWALGWPLGLAFVLDVGAYAVFAAVLGAVGDAHLAAHVVVVRVLSVSFLPGHAIAEATGVLVGQAVGAGRPAAAWQAIGAGARVATALMAACGLGFWIAPEWVLAPFGVDPEVARIGAGLLLVAGGFQVFDAIAMVLSQSLSGAGDTRFVTVTTTLASWFVKLPLGYALAMPLGLGAMGAWLGITAEVVLLSAVLVARARSARWLPAARPAPAG
jgi:MATE family multidrug resistance protein